MDSIEVMDHARVGGKDVDLLCIVKSLLGTTSAWPLSAKITLDA